jgi:DNA gyrase subunit A
MDRTKEIDKLREEIADMEETLGSPKKIRSIIAKELKETAKKYGQPRKTLFFHADEIADVDTEVEIPDDPMHLFLTESGYFKKITPASLRMNAEQKLKENDEVRCHLESTNRAELIFLTNFQQAYKAKVSSFDVCKASVMGDYIPAKLQFDEGEYVVYMIVTQDYSGQLLFVFENGKAAKIAVNAYETKTNRKKLAKAFSDKSPLAAVIQLQDECDVLLRSDGGRAIIFNTEMVAQKAARDTQGVQVMNLKPKQKITKAVIITDNQSQEMKKYKVKSIPAAGAIAKDLPDVGQMEL